MLYSSDMPERQRGRDPNRGTQFVAGEPALYHIAAHYPNAETSEDAYDSARNLIANEPCDLSAFRFAIFPEHTWHVAVLGTPPQPELLRRVETTLLATGERVVLPDEALQPLVLRRLEQMQKGSWVERRSPRGPRRR